uniref:Uncharacterized protein LOC113795508 n=1 Tax=Dermatophagoides pteronyssinus TaxID=6956 RepID=A0A6P6YA90_DERPT|nr:uncharacterized protein LOC113795508 [Dermatophagoides pteronyssinus]
MVSVHALVQRMDTQELTITDARFISSFHPKWKDDSNLWPDVAIWHKYSGKDLDVRCFIKCVGDEKQCIDAKENLEREELMESNDEISMNMKKHEKTINELTKNVAAMQDKIDSLQLELNQIKMHQIESQSISTKVPIKIVGNLSVPMTTIYEALIIGFNNKGFKCLVDRVFGVGYFENKSWKGLSKEVRSNINDLITSFVTTGMTMNDSNYDQKSLTEKRKTILTKFQASLNIKKFLYKKGKTEIKKVEEMDEE